MQSAEDEFFEIYDLKVEVIAAGDGRPMVCGHKVGDYFTVTDGDMIGMPEGVRFPLFPLAALLPMLPAKQRPLQDNDWMASDNVIACPDPYCGGQFVISRGEKRMRRRSESTVTPSPRRA